jgi:pantoate--beta-alanine ligase
MEVIRSPASFREACDAARSRGGTVGFVPTMGDLHDGHASLVERARRAHGFVVLSIFVNPPQFDSPADLAAYPRRLDRDRSMAERLGVDVVFAPSEAEMYPDGRPEVTVDPGPLGERFEGAARPGHFRGVLTVVAKLFDLVGPSLAYFGEKDAQQLALVRRMVRDLDAPVEVIGCPTVRDPDGLALSSRNARLTKEERAAAPVLFEALSDAAALARQGERDANVLKAHMAKLIGAEPLASLDYVAVVDNATWEEPSTLDGTARALVAARFGGTHLIDNLLLPVATGSVQN